MRTVKFYHGADLKFTNLEVVVDNGGHILGARNLVGIHKNVPRITICGIFDSEKNTLTFGVSRCSSKDAYVKSIGRKLSEDRANASPFKEVPVPADVKISEVFRNTCHEIEAEIFDMDYPIKL